MQLSLAGSRGQILPLTTAAGNNRTNPPSL
jgi:hypothetical protein